MGDAYAALILQIAATSAGVFKHSAHKLIIYYSRTHASDSTTRHCTHLSTKDTSNRSVFTAFNAAYHFN